MNQNTDNITNFTDKNKYTTNPTQIIYHNPTFNTNSTSFIFNIQQIDYTIQNGQIVSLTPQIQQ